MLFCSCSDGQFRLQDRVCAARWPTGRELAMIIDDGEKVLTPKARRLVVGQYRILVNISLMLGMATVSRRLWPCADHRSLRDPGKRRGPTARRGRPSGGT